MKNKCTAIDRGRVLSAALLVVIVGACLSQASRAEAIAGWWLDRIAIPEGIATMEAQRFLIERVPPLVVPNTKEAWLENAAALRQSVLQTVYLEGVPDAWLHSLLRVEWGDVIEHDGYTIRKLRYEAVPGLWIPAAVYEPADGEAKIPAVLNVNGHSYDKGKADEAEQVRCVTLAKNGILAFHPEWYACGELGAEDYRHGNLAYLDVVGVRGVSLFFLAMQRALDVLLEHPRTDSARVAMTGLSGGGWQTAVLSALDERVTLTAPVAGHAGMVPRIEALYDLGDLEQVPSELLTMADYTHLSALFAPRPALFIYNQRDSCCFLPERALPTTYDAALPVYRLLGAEKNVASYINEDPGTHNYETDNRGRFYDFLEAHFLGRDREIVEQPLGDGELHSKEELYAGLPETNETFVSLAQRFLAAIERELVPDKADPNFEGWLRRHRSLLIQTVRPQRVAFTTSLRQSLSDSAVLAFRYELESDDWSVGALHVLPENPYAASITIFVADAGVASVKDAIDEQLAAGAQVLAFDPLFLGANMPYKQNPDTLAMVFGSVGEPLLGVQAGQIAGVCTWAKESLNVDELRLVCVGWNAGVAGLIACTGVNEGDPAIADLTLTDIPESLGELIAQRVKYDDKPALFCYRFLEHFDMPQLMAGCPQTRVVVAH